VYDVLRHPANNHRISAQAGVLGDECGRLLSSFFQARRK
jgi:tRNA(Arg) A34 adenosine deaminase TadA